MLLFLSIYTWALCCAALLLVGQPHCCCLSTRRLYIITRLFSSSSSLYSLCSGLLFWTKKLLEEIRKGPFCAGASVIFLDRLSAHAEECQQCVSACFPIILYYILSFLFFLSFFVVLCRWFSFVLFLHFSIVLLLRLFVSIWKWRATGLLLLHFHVYFSCSSSSSFGLLCGGVCWRCIYGDTERIETLLPIHPPPPNWRVVST